MVTIRYTTIGRNGQISNKEKMFKTEAAMQAWVEKQEESGNFGGIRAYSYSQTN